MQLYFPVFENLCPSWKTILHLGIRRTFPKGGQVFNLDSELDGIYLVVEGVIEVILHTSNGPRKTLFYVGQGGVFGEVMCFVKGTGGEAFAMAHTDCVLYFFSRDTIEGVIAEQHPRLMVELVRSSAYKIHMYTLHLKDSLNGDHFLRVCKMLLYLVQYKEGKPKNETGEVIVKPDMSQVELARMVGMHRVTFTKAIGQLKEMGIVKSFTKKRLVILDIERLERLIEENTQYTGPSSIKPPDEFSGNL